MQVAKAGWLRVQGKPQVRSLVLGQAWLQRGTSGTFSQESKKEKYNQPRHYFLSTQFMCHLNYKLIFNIYMQRTMLKYMTHF